MKRRFFHRRSERGAAAVEFAILAALVLVPLAFGLSEAGRALYQYNTLVKSTRDAARYLTSLPPGAGHAAAKCLAVYGNRTCSGSPLAPGLATGQVSICDASNCADHANEPSNGNGGASTGSINLVSVMISDYPYASLLPALFPSVTFGSAAFPLRTTMRQVL